MASDARQSGHSIGVAAAAVGLHPQTLREYERHGLVVPVRTPGGTRRYRDVEIDRLRRIVQLTSEGVSLAGVRFVLGLEDRLARAERSAEELERLLERHAPQAHAHHVAQRSRAERAAQEAAAVASTSMQHARGTGSRALVTRTLSVEIVHVPRPPRGPRWKNLE